jgi:hypothetical protein
MCIQRKPNTDESWSLVPLTPEYLPEQHSQYVTAIENALANNQIRNIALSGNFGVGKSSILREISGRNKDRVVELSMSTLAPIEVTQLDGAVPIQATTPTNRIQQEIVKQLLYREDSGKTPASRFRRIEHFQWWREIWTSVLLGFVTSIIFLLTGWTTKLAEVFSFFGEMDSWEHLVVLAIASGMALSVRLQLFGKIHIKQLSAGSATVSLDESSVSYFDQYLDEIVYFFEVSDRDIVIFEDIDRFNDSHIFETLRALNTLLNASPQIKKRICFIYAIRDSIFDRIGLVAEGRSMDPEMAEMNDPALAEAVRANRTKFFDLVIPVVPFITHRSARNLAAQLLANIKHEVVPELLDLAARYVPDMRLLKNVRNEFIVFRDRIFVGEGKQLKLTETDLFAMMLYKSTHLTDFEAIRIGRSKLDELYDISRGLVSENISKLESDLRTLRKRLAQIDQITSRSDQMADCLLAHVRLIAEALKLPNTNGRFHLRRDLKIDELKEAQFWKEIAKLDEHTVLQWISNNGQSLKFTRRHLVEALGDPLDPESWEEADRGALSEQINEKAENIKFLRGADLGDLVKRSEFLTMYKGADEKPFSVIAQMVLGYGMVYQLVRAGYINRNFTLYTSTFHGNRVGCAATNFIIHHVERGLMDEYFELAPNDVDAVVRESGKNALSDSALYNIAILDHLLKTDRDTADIMVQSLDDLGDSQTRFMQAYLNGGAERHRFIERFTAFSAQVLIYLVNYVELDDATRLELLNTALTSLSAHKQRVDASVLKYLSVHHAEFKVLTSDAVSQPIAERIGELFADSEIILPRLEPLTKQVLPSFVSRNLYEITRENLTIAIDNTETVALDAVRTANTNVYDHVLKHLSTYLDAICGESSTIDSTENLIVVIEDVVECEVTLLDEVIKHAAPECVVTDLTEVPEGAWSALAEHRRFRATFSNVSRYVIAHESVDVHLAKVLTAAERISAIDAVDDDSKVTLAIAILAAKDQIPSAALRVNLVTSLKLGVYLDVEDIYAEIGDLFALLLKHDVIEDEATSFQRIVGTDWPTRKGFILASKKFFEYMTPELLRPDLAELLTNDEIDVQIKNVIVTNADAYAVVSDSTGLSALAQFATLNKRELAFEVVQKMAQAGVNPQQVMLLLESHLASISRELLFAVLTDLGGEHLNLITGSQVKATLSKTCANLTLLKRLKEEGVVSEYCELESLIEVNKQVQE